MKFGSGKAFCRFRLDFYDCGTDNAGTSPFDCWHTAVDLNKALSAQILQNSTILLYECKPLPPNLKQLTVVIRGHHLGQGLVEN